jgi:hypothetical protein
MGITYGDHLIDSGYYDITPEQEREKESAERQCKPGECVCTEVIVGSVFTVYRCKLCGAEEWL